jgi:hypothetical protein
MLDGRSFSVHQPGRPHHQASKSLADGLVAQANPQDRDHAGKTFNYRQGDAGLVRRAGTRRNDNGFRLKLLYLLAGNLIIANHLYLPAQFAQVLDQVVGERIVVVDHQDHLYRLL